MTKDIKKRLPDGSPFLLYLIILFKEVWDELMEAATPSEELMSCTLGYRTVDLDTQFAETVNNRLTLDEIFRAPIHVHIVNLLVELVSIGENTIVGGLHIKTEDGTAERAKPGKLVEILQYDVESLVTTP
jgi:hypothetical protein